MSTIEHDPDESEHINVRTERFQRRLNEILKPENLADILYRDRKLSRTEIDAKVIELGYDAALRTLAALACSGDTKALDLFLKRCDLYHATRRGAATVEDAAPAPYTRPQRQSINDDSETPET